MDGIKRQQKEKNTVDPKKLIKGLIASIETLFRRINELKEVDMTLSDRELNFAKQALHYLHEARLQRVNPQDQLQILTTCKHLTSEELA